MRLLSSDRSNAKLAKNQAVSSIRSYILYLVPSDASGLRGPDGAAVNLCPAASAGCRAACLFTAGRGAMRCVAAGRLRKTRWWVEDRPGFLSQLHRELTALQRRAARTGQPIAVRLNGTSDIEWERHLDLSLYPNVQFYDYTKIARRFGRTQPANYHLTFSRSEDNGRVADRLMAQGVSIAVVFDRIPESWQGRPVIDGTAHDLRFLDPSGVIVGLTPKGRARRDCSGFVVRNAQVFARASDKSSTQHIGVHP